MLEQVHWPQGLPHPLGRGKDTAVRSGWTVALKSGIPGQGSYLQRSEAGQLLDLRGP